MDVSTIAYSLTTTDMSVANQTSAKMWSAAYRGRNMLLGAVGIVLNVLTLVAVVRHHDLTKYLRCALVNLVSTDLGLMATMFVGSVIYLPPDALTLSLIYLVVIFIDCTAFTLLAIAVDRAAAVFCPAWHSSISERRVKMVLAVLCPWLAALGLTALSMEADAYGLPRYPVGLLTDLGLLLQGLVLLLCGLGVLGAYLAVGVRLRLRTRRLVVHPSFVSSAATGSISPSEGLRTRRLTVHLAFLAVWFCVIYIAFSSYLLTLYLRGVNRLAELNSPRNIIMSSFITVNSVSNPIIFFWRLVDCRAFLDGVKRVFSRAARGSRAPARGDVEMGYRLPAACRGLARARNLAANDVRTLSHAGSCSASGARVACPLDDPISHSSGYRSCSERPPKRKVIFAISGAIPNQASSYALED